MMKQTGLKYIFFISSALLLILMILMSRDAGISCDEVLHYNHSLSVYNYFASHGADRSALETPVSHLRYYGQSYDNLATILIKWLQIDDVFVFRHFMSSVAGWLTIFITALFAVWLSGYGSGIIVLILFAVSPTFLGHSLNNLKDIPFALSYISAIFFTIQLVFSEKRVSLSVLILLILSLAFSISVRAGGLILICYLYLIFFMKALSKYPEEGKLDLNWSLNRLIIITLVSGSAYFLSILLWPYALQAPLKNVFESYSVMAHFPGTFRQVFEGITEWSDFMPWYYLPKSMAVTIPLIVMTGFFLFFIFLKKVSRGGKCMIYGLILFTVVFPVIFVIFTGANLYSSWRQFLFLYPAIVLIAALGFNYLFESVRPLYRYLAFIALLLLIIHPVKFIVKNHPYEYLYYNQIAGGTKGAYGNYELDYYYVSQTRASEWLIKYMEGKNIDSAIVKATFSVEWPFRNHPAIGTSYIRNEEKSQSDWDYAIITNRYISPYKLKNALWPDCNPLHTITVDGVPVCVILERKSKSDYYGYKALEEGRTEDAIHFFEEILKIDIKDEMIFYNFARALYDDGQYNKAISVLKSSLDINPDFELSLMYLGNISKVRKEDEEAIRYYEKLIGVNRKYFPAYVELSELLLDSDMEKARKVLTACLIINPKYRPAIIAMADTYRSSDPEIAEKYDELANMIK